MDAKTLLDKLFPGGCEIAFDDLYFSGTGESARGKVAVIGSIDAAPIGVELAFRMAGEVLRIVSEHPAKQDLPARPILLLVDTQGQRLSRRDELLGINGYMAHLAKCLQLARNRGHKIIGLVYSEAVSGGFLASSLLADRCYALPEAQVRVMNLPAMSRITKIPLERLEELSKTSPVFAPGVQNYLRMGAVDALWEGDLAACLVAALDTPTEGDQRRFRGEERGGRMLARSVAERVRHAAV
jgi:malonate decarboxylase gamma subunit